MNTVTDERLDTYFSVTARALALAQQAPRKDAQATAIIIDMVERYVSDAHHFRKKNDSVLAFAALNYAHGWLDCGARLGLFIVTDDTLFTVDVD